MKELATSVPIQARVRIVPSCPLCGSPGWPMYKHLNDRLFGFPGNWGISRCESPNCGAAWVNPMIIPDDLPMAYRAYYTHPQGRQESSLPSRAVSADAYRSLRFSRSLFPATFAARLAARSYYFFPARRAGVEFPIQQFGLGKGRKLLEIGCGAGGHLSLLEQAGWRTTGVDFDESAVAYAQRQGLNVRLGSVEGEHFEDQAFDAVLMHHVLEHLPKPLSTMKEVLRILVPGARLVITTPNIDSWGSKHFRESWRGLEPPRHLHLFTARALEALAQQAGCSEWSVRISCRASIQVLRESWKLKHGGTRREDAATRLFLEGAWFWEWMSGLWGEPKGEELLLIAEK